MPSPVPTVVVGVGQTGIDVISQLDRSSGFGWGEQYDDLFDYVAIDTTRPDLEKAPERATRVFFQLPDSGQITQDRQRYPYLTDGVEIEPYGTDRQRRVGRYRLDNSAPATWGDLITKLRDVIRPRIESVLEDDTQPNILNIVHIHSLSGGTGSGTFPLIGHLLGVVTNNLQDEKLAFTAHIIGIGIVPELNHSLDTLTPPGDNRLYANTFAALRDLDKLLSIDSDNQLPIYRYAAVDNGSDEETTRAETTSKRDELTTNPYDYYFLKGVDENLMTIASDPDSVETYREMVDNTIVGAIYGLAMRNAGVNGFDGGIGNQGWRQFGAFDHSQLSIPIEDVRTYCDLTERISDLRDQLGPENEETGTLHQTLKTKRQKRDMFAAYARDPERTLQKFDDPDKVRSDIIDHIDRYIGTDESVTDTTMGTVDSLLDDLEKKHNEYILPFVLDQTVERIESHENSSERLADFVSTVRQDLNLQMGEQNDEQRTVTETAQILHDHLSEEIEELEDHLNSDSRRLPRVFRYVVDFFTRRRLERYQTRFRELQKRRKEHESVKDLLNTIYTRRQSLIENCFEEKTDYLEREIDDLLTEIKEKENELEETLSRKSKKLEQLTTANYGNRLGYVALDEQRIKQDLDRQTLEEDLTSIVAFQDQGFLKRDLQELLENRIQRAYAWDSSLLTWRTDGNLSNRGTRGTTTRQIWMLHHEENAELPKPNTIGAGNCSFYRSTETAAFPEFTDPYTIQFMSFTTTGPISDLTLYSILEEAAEDGLLNQLLSSWDDYRFAIAYPEWYTHPSLAKSETA